MKYASVIEEELSAASLVKATRARPGRARPRAHSRDRVLPSKMKTASLPSAGVVQGPVPPPRNLLSAWAR